MSERPVISIATSCFNECENIRPFYDRCMAALREFPEWDYEFVVADNSSTDGTRDILRELAAKDKNFKVILNAGNAGHIRSPYNALMNTSGDAVFYLCSDLQEPRRCWENSWRSAPRGTRSSAACARGRAPAG